MKPRSIISRLIPRKSKTITVKDRFREIHYKGKTYRYHEFFISLYINIPRDWVEKFGRKWKLEYYNPDRRRRYKYPFIILYPEVENDG